MKAKQKHELFLNRSVKLLQGKMKESEILIDNFKNACRINDKDKRNRNIIFRWNVVRNLYRRICDGLFMGNRFHII